MVLWEKFSMWWKLCLTVLKNEFEVLIFEENVRFVYFKNGSLVKWIQNDFELECSRCDDLI